MNSVVRFWLVVLSLLVGVAALGYLFVSFLFPGAAFVVQDPTTRLVATVVGVTAIGVFVWAAAFVEPGSSDQRDQL